MVDNLELEFSENSGYSFTFFLVLVTLLLGRTNFFKRRNENE